MRVSTLAVRPTALLCVLFLFSSWPLSADVWVAGDARIAKVASSGQILVSLDSVFGRGFTYGIGLQDLIGVNQRNGQVWVSDVNNNRIFQLNADGTPLREITLLSPFGIGIDVNSGAVWTSFLLNEVTFPRAVVKVDPGNGEELARVTGFSGFVSAIAVTPSGEVWIADRFNNEVVVLFGADEELNGYDASAPSGPHHLRLGEFNEPYDIDIDPGNGSQRGQSTWVADRLNGEAVKIASDGTELVRVNPTGFFEVRFVSVDRRDGSVWVGDPNSGRIAKLSDLGTETQSLSIIYPTVLTALSVDAADDAVWIGTGFDSEARVLKLDSNGSEVTSANGLGTIRGIGATSSASSVGLDIFPNSINPRSKGVIPVAILSTNGLDTATIDQASLRFGPDQALVQGRGQLVDVNGDGLADLVLHFRTQQSGIQCGDSSVSITGQTVNGASIEGSDSITTVGCKAGNRTKR